MAIHHRLEDSYVRGTLGLMGTAASFRVKTVGDGVRGVWTYSQENIQGNGRIWIRLWKMVRFELLLKGSCMQSHSWLCVDQQI